MPGPKDYTVGWICAVKPEIVAARAFLDEVHTAPDHVPKNDNNTYILGRIGNHNVVIAALPHWQYGLVSAATVARDMVRSFPNVRIGLMVGIGGGAPSQQNDIRLGDIVVASPGYGNGGIFQYDYGKTVQDESFTTTGHLNQPPQLMLTALSILDAQYESEGNGIEESINRIFDANPRLRNKYQRPHPSTDRLYRSSFKHRGSNEVSCTEVCGNNESSLVGRIERAEDEDTTVHYGLIASANQLMKDALIRDKLSAEKNVLCFEMEAAGLMNHFPCLVVRGICDYSDTHKNLVWQGYAAMAAAAYAKQLLYTIAPNKVEAERKLSEVLRVSLKGIRKEISDVSIKADHILSHQHNQDDEDILKWLTPTDYASRRSDIIGRRQRGTGQWFLGSSQFQKWVNGKNETLYCPGIPGAGKTMMTTIVIEDLHSRFSYDQTTGIAYIYCDFLQKDKQRAQDSLESLLKQLAQEQSSLPASVKDLYDQHHRYGTKPSFDEISRALHSVAATYSRIFIVVDALDECKTSDDDRAIFLNEIFQLQNHTVANIFATSRPSREVSDYFTNGLSLTISASYGDISTFVNEQLSLRQSDDVIDDIMRHTIKTEIAEAADGMFLLAKLQTEAVLSCLTKGRLKEVLRTLEKGMAGLDKTYDQAMRRIEDQGNEREVLAKQTLMWISHSKRPLSISELQHVLAVRLDTTALDADFLPRIQLISSLCAGLVVVDEKSSIVRLVHYTTQEYLERTQKQWFPEAESDITKTCLTYLLFDAFKDGYCITEAEFDNRLAVNPLYNYAARHWGNHAHEAAVLLDQLPAKSRAALCSLVISFLESTKKVEASSQALLARKDLFNIYYSQKVPRNMKGLHLAAYFGLTIATECLLDNGQDVDATDSTGRTPLAVAVEEQKTAVVELLLKRGAKVDYCYQPYVYGDGYRRYLERAPDGYVLDFDIRYVGDGFDGGLNERTPLSRAAEIGDETIVQLLLKYRARPDYSDRHSQTPLSRAIGEQQTAVVELLLDKGAKANRFYHLYGDYGTKDRVETTPLSHACKIKYKAMIDLLLEYDAQLHDSDRTDPVLSSWITARRRKRRKVRKGRL